jgi:LPS-assembly protein
MHQRRNKASIARFALSPVAVVAASLLQPLAAQGQTAAEPSPRLRPSPLLREDLPADRTQLPTFVEGDRIQGRTDLETTVEGNAVLRRGDTVIRARRLEYNQPNDLARAIGDVRINKAGNVFEGPLLELQVDAFQGFFNEPRYRFLANDAYGQAERIDFLDEKRAIIRKATYTTCQRKPGPGWMPDWILRAASISLDQEEQTGYATGAVLNFMGVPILPVPALSFPLGDERKSGLLPPTIGLDSKSGLELTLPYYWNIAPNRDATFYPTLMTRRGVDLAGEFRYLESNYEGMLRGNYLPGDRLRGQDRWGFAATHSQPRLLLPAFGNSSLYLNLNRVSDDNYWRDFSRSSGSLTQRLLANDGSLNWSWFDVSFTAGCCAGRSCRIRTRPSCRPTTARRRSRRARAAATSGPASTPTPRPTTRISATASPTTCGRAFPPRRKRSSPMATAATPSPRSAARSRRRAGSSRPSCRCIRATTSSIRPCAPANTTPT